MGGAREPSASAGRLFLGVAMSETARGELASELHGERLPGRVVPSESWHLTLTYLGDISREALERLHRALLAVNLGRRTEIVLGGLGAFPRAARASVLWLGVQNGGDDLLALKGRVTAAVTRAGLPAEERRFVPHLTLSRINPPGDVRELIERAPPIRQPIPLDAVVLFRSHTGSGPARYEELERYRLSP